MGRKIWKLEKFGANNYDKIKDLNSKVGEAFSFYQIIGKEE